MVLDAGHGEDYYIQQPFILVSGRNLNVPLKPREILQTRQPAGAVGFKSSWILKLMWTSFYCFSHCARMSYNNDVGNVTQPDAAVTYIQKLRSTQHL